MNAWPARLDDALTSRAFIADPYPTYRVLRDEHPLYVGGASRRSGRRRTSRNDDSSGRPATRP